MPDPGARASRRAPGRSAVCRNVRQRPERSGVMAQLTAMNPISNLMYDWLTVLHEKAEGLAAYEKYIRDAEEAGSQECVEMFRKLYERSEERRVGKECR